ISVALFFRNSLPIKIERNNLNFALSKQNAWPLTHTHTHTHPQQRETFGHYILGFRIRHTVASNIDSKAKQNIIYLITTVSSLLYRPGNTFGRNGSKRKQKLKL
ncbi:MAG: hypothetical protein ACI8RD_012817, partial [Bacillariaceae sp.]